jgi:tetratricopeptide (TPR) repeat protein
MTKRTPPTSEHRGSSAHKLAAALEIHRSGRLADAAQVYRSIVRKEPRNFDALYLLGLALLQQGQWEAAEERLRLAVQIQPKVAEAHANRGTALLQLGRHEEALASFNDAIKLQPGLAEVFGNRGNALTALGRLEEAAADFERAIALQPRNPSILNNYAAALQKLKRFDEALAKVDLACMLAPWFSDAFNNRGLILKDQKRFAEALESFDQAIALSPTGPACANRGLALNALGRIEEALESAERAIALSPGYAKAHYGRANYLTQLKRINEALESHDRAIALDPALTDAYLARSVCKLLAGNFAEGWAEYEGRWNAGDFHSPRSDLPFPHWKGEDLQGRSILVYVEQGLGDMIQFVRYLPLLEARGAQVSLSALPHLHRLFGSLSGSVELVTPADKDLQFDVQVALMSLPHRFGTTLANVPAAIPYLSSEAERSEFWRNRIGPEGYRVGINWRGNQNLADRSFALSALLPFSQIEGVRLISLQKGDPIEELDQRPEGMPIEFLGEDFDSGPDAFIDSAAAMASLDLVVTCDTSIAHLAGALGKPVWIALKYMPDWRWMLDRSDSPWYPTARLYRQPRAGEWGDVMKAMAADLTSFIAGQSRQAKSP